MASTAKVICSINRERGFQGPLWEYACSKGNNGAIQIMVGARNAEKAASEKPKSPAGIPISQAK